MEMLLLLQAVLSKDYMSDKVKQGRNVGQGIVRSKCFVLVFSLVFFFGFYFSRFFSEFSFFLLLQAVLSKNYVSDKVNTRKESRTRYCP